MAEKRTFYDISDICLLSSVCGILTSLSPMKSRKTSSFFNGELTDRMSACIQVCFTNTLRLNECMYSGFVS